MKDLDVVAVERELRAWAAGPCAEERGEPHAIALDGKTSGFAVAGKSLPALPLEGASVSADANLAPRELCKAIIESGGACERFGTLPFRMASARSLLVVDRFAPEGKRLRAHFDERLADPRSARADRFVWDFWHVPGQYTLLRTPAWRFFPSRLYRSFHRRLVLWGRRTLGCHDISPPWLSCYVEGCRQEWHGDLPHGPWAFVYSLTKEPRAFRGGETLLLRDEVLDFWRDFRSERSVEEGEILAEIAPRPDRLIVFDPRLPHAVRRVEGTLDPRLGRLVVHGWFVRPRPFIEGPLPPEALSRAIAEVSERAVLPVLERGLPLAGIVSFAFRVEAGGAVRSMKVLSDTTRVPPEEDLARRRFLRGIAAALRALRFPRTRGASRVTLPLVFER